MSVIEGVYDGNAIQLLEKVDWEPNQKVSVILNSQNEHPVMGIFGKISHEEAEEIRLNRLSFGEK